MMMQGGGDPDDLEILWRFTDEVYTQWEREHYDDEAPDMRSEVTGRSLAEEYPRLAEWWGPDNSSSPGDWDPDLEAYSNFLCPQGHHFWRFLPEMVDLYHTDHGGCFVCEHRSNAQRLLTVDTPLSASRPDLAALWSERNDLGPEMFDQLEFRPMWWRCEAGHTDYQCSVQQRAGIRYVGAMDSFQFVEPYGCLECEAWSEVDRRREENTRLRREKHKRWQEVAWERAGRPIREE